MFYRFISKLATQERLRAFPVSLSGEFNNPDPDDYEACFEPVKQPRFPGLNGYHAPSMDWGTELALRFDPGCETTNLPDIWGVENRILVSDKVAAIIAATDPLRHDFTAFNWLDANNRVIDTGQAWYALNVRRFLDIQPSERIATATELGFCPMPRQEDFLGRVLDEPDLAAVIEQQPVWQGITHFPDPRQEFNPYYKLLYLNQALVNALRAEAVTGMDEYSAPFGRGEQALVPISLTPSVSSR